MNITLAGTKVSMDGHTLAFQKNNLVDSMVITVDTDETWQYKLDVKYPCKDSKGEQLYNVIDLTRVGNTCTAILQATMLPFNGKYTMQLRGISGNKVYHTDTFDVWVKYSIDPSKVYDPVPSEFYQIEANITSMNNHPPKPGNNGYWLVWNMAKQEYEESDVPLPEGTLPEVSDFTNGWYLTNDGERVYWAEVQGGSGEGDITAIQVNGIDQPIVDKVAKLTIDKDTVGLGNLDNVRQYSSVNQPPYPVTSVDGSTGDVATLSVKYTKQALTVAQQQQARENIGAGTSNFDGSYDSLTGKPDIPSKTSELENDAGYITATQAPVQSVNGQTGDVVLNAESVGALPSTTKIPSATSDLTNDSGYITAADAPVQSVNGQTGVVQLDIPTALPNPNALTIKIGSTTTTYDGSSAQTVDVPTDDNPLGITGAQVGQIAKITAVDTDGKPTAWEAANMPSGGGGGGHWETVLDTVWEQDVINPTAYDAATGIFTCAAGELDNLELNTEYAFFSQCKKEGVAYNTILANESLRLTKLSDTTFSTDATPPTTFVVENVKFSRGACLAITNIDARKIRLTLDGQFKPTATFYDYPFYKAERPYFGRNTGYQQIRNAFQAYQQVTAEVESPYRIVGEILCGFNAPSQNGNFHFKNNSFCCPLVPSLVTDESMFNSDGTKIMNLYSTMNPWHIGTGSNNTAILNDYLKIISGTKVKLERWVE